MSLELRPAGPDDVDALVAIALRAFEPVHASMAEVLGAELNARVYPDWAASQEADVRAACADPDLDTVVAVRDHTIVGFACLAVDADERVGEIDMIAVDPAVHGVGVGRALTSHALEHLTQAGCTLVHVATGGDVGHAPARALYAAAGFTPLPLVRYYREL